MCVGQQRSVVLNQWEFRAGSTGRIPEIIGKHWESGKSQWESLENTLGKKRAMADIMEKNQHQRCFASWPDGKYSCYLQYLFIAFSKWIYGNYMETIWKLMEAPLFVDLF
jgi:hypothetical protein